MRKIAALVVALAGVLALVAPASAQDPPALRVARGLPLRAWRFSEYLADGTEAFGPRRYQVGGLLEATEDFGPTWFDVEPVDGVATGRIFATNNGSTYSVFAQSPRTFLPDLADLSRPIGNKADFEQYQNFRKDDENATLSFRVTSALIQAIDLNGRRFPGPPECPATDAHCLGTMEGTVTLSVHAYTTDTRRTFFNTSGTAKVFGWQGHFDFDVTKDTFATSAFLEEGDFDWEPHNSGPLLSHAMLSLREPRTFPIDLSSVGVGEEFTMRVDAFATTYDRRYGNGDDRRGSTVSAYLRDPLEVGGSMLQATGLTPVDDPLLEAPAPEPLPAAVCEEGPDPAAGTLQFSAADYNVGEWAGAGPQVVVTRTGGSVGEVSATFTTSDGTALAGSDYTALSGTVVFADGDTAARSIAVEILQDDTAEDDTTVNLTLSDPSCVTLGAPSTTVLTIVDDDRPTVPDPTFSIGGTVSGLEGTGLVLSHLGELVTPGNGAFTFAQTVPDGFPYDVRVDTQPSAPDQICSVSSGAGTIAGADVTDIAVECVTPPPDAELDPTFGGDGKVTTPGLRGSNAVAVQADGKLVVAGEFSLARYEADGELDLSFGGGDGKVTTGLSSGILDTASDVAIAPDGKIVVAGIFDTGPSDDFGVERYDINGVLDPTFGGGDGKVITDFHGGIDRAYGVAVQPDGKIVVAGHATDAAGTGNDFAVARYGTDGVLDPSFGEDGTGLVTTDVAGVADFAYAIALQPDGSIVLAGRASDDGAGGYFGLARYTPDGRLDESFGSSGTTVADFGHGGVANAVVVQPDDGKIVIAGDAIGDFAVARFDPNGSPDHTFGTLGLVTTDFGLLIGNQPAPEYAHDLVLQADGRIVVVGTSEFAGGTDLAMARYHSDGELDGSFGNEGTLAVDFNSGFDSGHGIGVQHDGKIVAVGTAQNGFSFESGLVRVVP